MGEDPAADAAALAALVHREHGDAGQAAAAAAAPPRDLDAGHGDADADADAVVVGGGAGDQERAVGPGDPPGHLLDVDGEARREAQVVRPPGPAVFGAEGGLHQLLDARRIIQGRNAELEVAVGHCDRGVAQPAELMWSGCVPSDTKLED